MYTNNRFNKKHMVEQLNIIGVIFIPFLVFTIQNKNQKNIIQDNWTQVTEATLKNHNTNINNKNKFKFKKKSLILFQNGH